MAVNFSGKRKSEEDLLKKNGMTNSGTTGKASSANGQGVGINPYDETAMRIAMSQHYENPKDDINVINPQPDDFVGPVLNPYAVKGQAQTITPGTDTGMLPSVTQEMLPVDSGYTGAGQAAPAASDWNEVLMELARRQVELNGQMPTGAPGAGGTWNDLYRQMAEQYMNRGAYQPQQAAGGGDGQESWNDMLDRMAREQVGTNNYAPYDPETYDRMKATWLGKADRQAAAAAEQARAGAGGYGTSYASVIGQNAYDASLRQSQADHYDQQKAAWERNRQMDAQRMSIASDMASRETSERQREDAEALAAWERQRQQDADALSIAGSMADREYEAAQLEYQNKVNEWNMMREANTDNLSVAKDMAAWELAQQQADGTAESRVQGLYQNLSQVYDGTNEATVRSQMRNAGYTEDEINNAMNMVKNDMAAAVEDQAKNYFGNQSAYDQMAQNNVISNEQAVAAKEMDSDNMTRALASAMSNPASAAQALGMDEATAAEFAAMDEDSQMNWVVDTAGQMVLDHQINDMQFSQIIQPQVDDYLEEITGSKNYTREVSDIVVMLKQYKDMGYLGSDAFGYMMQKIAAKIDPSQFSMYAYQNDKFSDAQLEAHNELINYMSDERRKKLKNWATGERPVDPWHD